MLKMITAKSGANDLDVITDKKGMPTQDDRNKGGGETTVLGYNYIYDAWDRLVIVKDAANTNIVEEFRYNGLGHRIALHYDMNASGGNPNGSDPWVPVEGHKDIKWMSGRVTSFNDPATSPTRSDYAWQHEPCFYGWVQGKRPPRAPGKMRSTVWPIDTLANGPERPDHPTPKPLEVFEIPIEQHTKPGEVCYEPFAGSGTQLIAAERLGRRCFALEVSAHYCDLIVRRWIHQVGPANAPRSLVARYALPTSAQPEARAKGGTSVRTVQRKKVPA